MKAILSMLALVTLSGCSTYSTHLRTGCIWSCAEWEKELAKRDSDPNYYVSGPGSVYVPSASGSSGITASQYNLPSGGYMVIRSGSTTSVIQTSKSR